MSLDDAVQTIAKKGFTERQARFLVLVARHSGVCVMRQYAAFAGTVFGQKTRKFFAKLASLGWVSTYDCAHNRARIYHLRHRDLYTAIGEPESRLRRPPAVPRALERLMVLDTILEHPDIVWLATPEEKVAHLTTLTRVPLEDLPHQAIGQGEGGRSGTSRIACRSASIPRAESCSSTWSSIRGATSSDRFCSGTLRC
jgi:hypothetical protein